MYLQQLSDKIWLTRSARFAASKRMKRNRISSTASVALLSASIIGVNMLAFLTADDNDKTMITIVSIILSTFALVMSLLISLLRYEWREQNYHQCGIELEDLNQKLQIHIEELVPLGHSPEDISSPPQDNLQYLEQYISILRKYNLNHTDFDFHYGKKDSQTDQLGCWKLFCLQFRWYIWDVNILYWLIAIIPIVIIIFCFLKNTLKLGCICM